MVKVLTAGRNAKGSSMVVIVKIENAIRHLGVSKVQTAVSAVREAKGLAVGYDIVVASNQRIHEVDGRPHGKLIGLDSLVDDKEIKTKLEAAF
ncbi:PTS ascorbate transporter subunit IIB [Streptococcus hyointestinalis]|uniref:PTS ascorbate transporter subunit IIB n=1 Tax=Streptococcus hyointestinalis TaxID=1337 RepID=UPI0013DEC850|nr:PTS ascorbate transporter subunit IIB [Streptococcus hyointestinalis]